VRFVWVAAGLIWIASAGLVRGQQPRAQEPALTWQAPEGCPTREVWLSLLRSRVDEAAWNEAAPKLRAAVRIDTTDTGYALQLDTELDGATGQRRIEAASCAELVDASALIVAFAIDPEAASRAASSAPIVASDGAPAVVTPVEGEPVAPAPAEAAPPQPPPPEPAPPEAAQVKRPVPRVEPRPKGVDRERAPEHARAVLRPRAQLFVRPLAMLDTGTLPTLGVGPSLAVGLRIRRISLELGVSYLPAQLIIEATDDRIIGELRWLAGSAGACYSLFPDQRLDAAPCVRMELGRLWGRGRNLEADMVSAGATWLALLAGAQVSYELLRGLAVGLEVAAGLPLLASAFRVDAVGEVHETPSVVGRLSAGVTLSF